MKINQLICTFFNDNKSDLKVNNSNIIKDLKFANDLPEELIELHKLVSSGFIYLNENATWRIISIEEIDDIEDNYGYDILKNDLFPIFDCFDNDFICYDLKKREFVCFNISDEIIFDKFDCLAEFIEKKINS